MTSNGMASNEGSGQQPARQADSQASPTKAPPPAYEATGLNHLTELLLEKSRTDAHRAPGSEGAQDDGGSAPDAAAPPGGAGGRPGSMPPSGVAGERVTLLGPPSQSDLGTPQLLDSQGPGDSGAGSPTSGDVARGAAVPSFLPLANVDFASMQANPELFASLAAWAMPGSHLSTLGPASGVPGDGGGVQGQYGEGHYGAGGEGVAGAGARKALRPTRRGPMDEMRQLVRILVKLLPQSIGHIGSGEEAGGGNRISEEQIKQYLDATLGEAPRPPWGVPDGWHSYVATLLSWAGGRPVDEEHARRVAKRDPGRSWEALESELSALGAHPNAWPLPLSLEGVRAAEADPVPQPVPQAPQPKPRATDAERSAKRQRVPGAQDLERCSELELWRLALDVLAALGAKAGSTPVGQAGALAGLRNETRARLDAVVALGVAADAGVAGGGPAAGPAALGAATAGGVGLFPGLQYVPVVGMDGGSSMLTLLGGLAGLPLPGASQHGAQPGAPMMGTAPHEPSDARDTGPAQGGRGGPGPGATYPPGAASGAGPPDTRRDAPGSGAARPHDGVSGARSISEFNGARPAPLGRPPKRPGDGALGVPADGAVQKDPDSLLASGGAREQPLGSLEGVYRSAGGGTHPPPGGTMGAQGTLQPGMVFPLAEMYASLVSPPRPQ